MEAHSMVSLLCNLHVNFELIYCIKVSGIMIGTVAN